MVLSVFRGSGIYRRCVFFIFIIHHIMSADSRLLGEHPLVHMAVNRMIGVNFLRVFNLELIDDYVVP